MILYCTPYAPIPDPSALQALMPPARRQAAQEIPPGPLFAYALLAWTLDRHHAIAAKDAIAYTEAGKPYLPKEDKLHLSLSHSKTHALCALAPFPIGCDIETHRPLSQRIQHRVLGNTEAPENFFAYWTLKESYVKLTGDLQRPFSTLTFTLTGDQAQGQNTHGWLYQDLPDSTIALLAKEPFPRPKLTILTPETIFAYASEKGA